MQPGRRTCPDLGLRSCKWNLGQITSVEMSGESSDAGKGDNTSPCPGWSEITACAQLRTGLVSSETTPSLPRSRSHPGPCLGSEMHCPDVWGLLGPAKPGSEVMPKLELSQQPQLSGAEHTASGCRHRS